MLRKYVREGDITKFPVEAIATLINSSGLWFGGVDGAIQRVAEDHYHHSARIALNTVGLSDGATILVSGDHNYHNGSFDHVVFVVDDLKRPLSELVYLALERVYSQGITSVALPLMRSGVMLGVVEPDVKAVVQEMLRGIDRFDVQFDPNMELTVIVYDNRPAVNLLSSNMTLLNN